MSEHISSKESIVIGGFVPLTTIDFPEALAAVIFMQGCPWRCGYCQNTELLPPDNPQAMAWTEIVERLVKRQVLLDAVVFSGGEPTLQSGLVDAIQEVRSMGYKIGLHSAGIYPERFERVLPLVDWVGFDIKSARKDYAEICGARGAGERAWKSAEILLASGVDHEFRTTVHPGLLNQSQLYQLADELVSLGVQNYVIQKCVPQHCHDESLRVLMPDQWPAHVIDEMGQRFAHFSVRE